MIGGYIPGARGFDALLVGVYEKRELMFVAKVKNGFVHESEMSSSRLSGPANCPVSLQESAREKSLEVA